MSDLHCTGTITIIRSCRTASASCIRRALLILGMGYLFALIHLFHTYAGRADGNPMMLGLRGHRRRLFRQRQGLAPGIGAARTDVEHAAAPTKRNDAGQLGAEGGADRPTYEKTVRPILDKRCMACHDGSNPHLPNLSGYDNMKKVTEKDTGRRVFTLVRVSHIHLFGMTSSSSSWASCSATPMCGRSGSNAPSSRCPSARS